MRTGNLKLSLYDTFSCVAGNCPYSCCRDWQGIPVDPAAMNAYRSEAYIMSGIDEKEQSFRKREEDNTCFFLNRNSLCDLVLHYGTEALCYTCDTFPRIITKRVDVTEYTLSNGCAEVLRLLDTAKSPMSFIYDKEAFSTAYLSDESIRIRDCMINILQLGTLPLIAKLQMLYMFTERMQSEGTETSLLSFSQEAFLSALGGKLCSIPVHEEQIVPRLQVFFNAFAKRCQTHAPFHTYLEPFFEKNADMDQEYCHEIQNRFHDLLTGRASFFENICVNYAFRHLADTDPVRLQRNIMVLALEMVLSTYTVVLNMISDRLAEENDLFIIVSHYARITEHNEETMRELTATLTNEMAFDAADFFLIVRFLQ